MNNVKILLSAAMLLLCTFHSGHTLAGDKELIETFYAKLLNVGGSSDLAKDGAELLANDWVSIGDYSGKTKNREGFLKGVGGLQKGVPDLKWEIQEIVESGDRFVVRGRASGTPAGAFFGMPTNGGGFDIMSIDIHKVANGKIVESHHVEDWSGAMRQLKKQ